MILRNAPPYQNISICRRNAFGVTQGTPGSPLSLMSNRYSFVATEGEWDGLAGCPGLGSEDLNEQLLGFFPSRLIEPATQGKIYHSG